MTGFNLPPGVEVHMIPGNRPEDAADEKFWEAFGKRANEVGFEGDLVDREWYDDDIFVKAIRLAHFMGYEEGYSEGLKEDPR